MPPAKRSAPLRVPANGPAGPGQLLPAARGASRSIHPRPSAATEPPFRYIGGDASLDLVNTVDWTARGFANERLTGYERLTRWAEGAGVLPRAEAERLRREARSRPLLAREACDSARLLRSVLQRLFRSVAAGERPDAAWEDFNQQLGTALERQRLAPRPRRGGAAADWAWRDPERRLDSLLWPVAWSAARLLTSDEAQRVRVCAGEDCGWMYVDRSRNRLRRWCEMETCGTTEKSRRRRERSRRAASR